VSHRNGPYHAPHWLDNGLIDAGGSHEPYLFVVRRGGQRLDARQAYEQAQSEKVIRTLKDQGVEVFHTHLYKGFGIAAEMPEMQDAVRAAAIAHRLGLKVDSYIQWNTLMYETFFAEQPRAKDWVQKDSLGRPIMLTYGFQQSYRYRPCFKNQEYLDYMKRIVQFAVQQVKTDFIHFDNFDLNPEPDSCHCPQCVNGFRKHLKTKYDDEQRRERFGFSNVDYVNPPEWNAQNPPARMQIIFDPAIQEWIDFRCQLMADALRQVASYAKSLNPEVVIEVNPHGITGGNRAWEAGIDHSRFLQITQVFWTEEPNLPSVQPDGRLISKIRSYKLARAYGNILLTYIATDELAIAECLAFNQTIGYAGTHPLSPVMLEYLDFYRKNRELFHHTTDVADVAVLRSYPSITYNHARCQLSAILAEQALIEERIPFRLIFDDHVADLSPYRVVVLPESECLSDKQIAAIRLFVERGGGLVVVGRSGLYDQWRRLRINPGLLRISANP
jgi:Beta-galactosidase trimerisation domain/Beta-galactosidase